MRSVLFTPLYLFIELLININLSKILVFSIIDKESLWAEVTH